MKLNANTSLNPDAPKICLLDIDGVVVMHGMPPYHIEPEILEKVKKLKVEGWHIWAFTCRRWEDVQELIARHGLLLDGYIPKPLASEMMIIDDILSEARNSL